MVRASDALWKHDWIPGFLAVAIVLLLHGLTNALAPFEHELYDLGVTTAGHAPPVDVSIITIDNGSTSRAGPWPVPREDLARLTEKLTQAGASLVVLALPFGHPQPEPAHEQLRRTAQALGVDPGLAGNASVEALTRAAQSAVSGDERLARSLRSSGRVVLAAHAHSPPIAPLAAAAAAVAEMPFRTDGDGVLRTQALFAGVDGKGAPVLPLVVAAHRLSVPLSEIRRIADVGVRMGARLLHTEDGDRVRAHFYASPGGKPAFAQVPFADVLSGRSAASRFAGHTVFIGLTSAQWTPSLATPLSIPMTPVEALAHVSSALSQGHIVVQPVWAQGATLLVCAAIGALLMWQLPRLRGARRFVLALALSALLLAAQWTLQIYVGQWVPLIIAVVALWLGMIILAMWPRPAPAPSPWQAVERRRVPRTGAAVSRPAPATTQSPASEPALPAASQEPARMTLGPYVVEKKIGHGAMGAMYLARDPQTDRAVAIKTLALRQEFEGDALEDARQRFAREAQTAGRLDHPDIVTVLGSGEDRELAWIAMEYLRGRDLAHYVRPAKLLPVPVVLRITARVAEALAYAHRQGVVHRDIKPANVMVDLAADMVKVTDFGIARIADGSRTRTGLVLGTPSFMSPEQMAGSPVDGRSDLYSAGVMLFQLLSGRLPHEAESMARLMAQIANETAPDIRTWRSELPESLANVVALALQKRPEVRYADGQQLARDLRAIEAQLDGLASSLQSADTVAPMEQSFADTSPPALTDPRHNSLS
jgi:serine/threonine protein kinase/CHASE2 domain-containing sensor protein